VTVKFDDLLPSNSNSAIAFDDLLPSKKKPRLDLTGKSFNDLNAEERAAIRDGLGNQVGSAIAGAADILSFGGSDELTAGLAAPGAFIANRINGGDASLGQAFDEQLQKKRDNLTNAQERNPDAFLAGQIFGGIGGGAGAGLTKAGAALSRGLRSGKLLGRQAGLAGRAVKGGAAGASLAGAQEFGSGEGFEDRISRAEDGLVVGGTVGAALPVAGAVALGAASGAKNLAKGAFSRASDALDDNITQLKDQSRVLFERADAMGANISKPKAVNISNMVEAEIKRGTKLNKRLHGDTLSVLKDFSKSVRRGETGLQDFENYRRVFSGVVKKNIFNNPDDARLAETAIDVIDDEIRKLMPIDVIGGDTGAINALFAARAQWAKMKTFETVSDVLKRADGDPNKIKSGLTRLLHNKRKMNSFTPGERATLKEAASSTTGEKLLKMFGKFGIDLGSSFSPGNTIGPLVGAFGAGAAAGTGAGAAVPVLGTIARQGQKLLARGKAETLLRSIEKRGVDLSNPASITVKQIKSLPPREAKLVLERLSASAAAVNQ
jgi:hypothetical protein